MANWIELGSRYITVDGKVTTALRRTTVTNINADKFPFCGMIDGVDKLLFWTGDGLSSEFPSTTHEFCLMDVFQPKEEGDDDLETYNKDLSFMFDVKAEVVKAREKFSNLDLAHAMTEEFGEVIKALLDQKQKNKVSSEEIYRECVQAAAMAMRLATEGDPCFPKYFPPLGDDK
jgi:hypothetical protein